MNGRGLLPRLPSAWLLDAEDGDVADRLAAAGAAHHEAVPAMAQAGTASGSSLRSARQTLQRQACAITAGLRGLNSRDEVRLWGGPWDGPWDGRVMGAIGVRANPVNDALARLGAMAERPPLSADSLHALLQQAG